MPRSLVQRLSPGALLLALGLIGLGPGSATAGSVIVEKAQEIRLPTFVLPEEMLRPPSTSSGATISYSGAVISIVIVDELEEIDPFEVVVDGSSGREIVYPEIDPLPDPEVPVRNPTAFVPVSRPSTVWYDENGVLWGGLHPNDISDRDGTDFEVLPPQYFPGGYAAVHGFLARNVGPLRPSDLRGAGSARYGRRDFVCASWEGGGDECLMGAGPPVVRSLPVVDPEALLGLPQGSLRSPGFDPVVFDPGALSSSWLTLLYLASRSCAGVDDPACFDESAPLREGACSFNEPLRCAGLEGFEAPWTAVAVDLDRMRVVDRGGRAKLRLKGRIDLEDAAQDGGVFSVAVGDMTASIPLDAFEKRGRRRVWRGDADGLRRVVLRDDGRFQILARDVASELLEGDTLPLLVQIGGALAATGAPLD